MRVLISVLIFGAGLVALASWYISWMPGERHAGTLAPLVAGDLQIAARLKEHVTAIASEEHNTRRPEALERSARHIEVTLAGLGYAVARQEFVADGVKVRNLEVTIGAPGFHLVVVGAHYDSAQGATGANDNGSGAATLLELARLVKDLRPAQEVEIRLVFYVNEEMPYFASDRMGSHVHASSLHAAGRQVTAMLSLETIGYYSDAPGSQRYPFPFNLLYPGTGDFIAFVGNLRSRALTQRVVGAFRRSAAFPSEGGVGPESVAGVAWSDQWAYWKYGWPAVMVTDTAPFRYPHYHTPRDTPDKLDYEKLARVVRGIEGVLRDLAGG